MLCCCVELERLEMDQMRSERGHDCCERCEKDVHLPYAQLRRVLSLPTNPSAHESSRMENDVHFKPKA